MRSAEREPEKKVSANEQARADLLFTLAICQKYLPTNADPIHWERLKRIERIVNDYFDQYQNVEPKRHA